MLIENGADVNITDDTGDTALHSAGRYDIPYFSKSSIPLLYWMKFRTHVSYY